MKCIKKSFALIMMICLVLSVAVPAFAADPPKDYCVIRVFGGTQRPGLVKSIPVERGEICNFGTELGDYLGTDVTDTKYYTKSYVRESGKEEEFPPSFTVDKDRDFVLTYGIKGDQVTYYVRYVDANGNNIAPATLIPGGRSGPFVANRNDQVYVAYVEIPGYQPDAYNRTATLSNDSRLLQSNGTFLFTCLMICPCPSCTACRCRNPAQSTGTTGH